MKTIGFKSYIRAHLKYISYLCVPGKESGETVTCIKRGEEEEEGVSERNFPAYNLCCQ